MAAEMAIVTAGTLQSPGRLPGYFKAGNTKTHRIPSDKCHKAWIMTGSSFVPMHVLKKTVYSEKHNSPFQCLKYSNEAFLHTWTQACVHCLCINLLAPSMAWLLGCVKILQTHWCLCKSWLKGQRERPYEFFCVTIGFISTSYPSCVISLSYCIISETRQQGEELTCTSRSTIFAFKCHTSFRDFCHSLPHVRS
jgi:hypothetical protein